MKQILATVYAVNPYKGSEDGMGWNFVTQIARYNHIIAITRENNRPHIEKYMKDNPCDTYERITFAYFDLPYWMRFWKKGARGAMLYYLMWQYGVYRYIKHQDFTFDIVHNLNFHNDWAPSFLWKLKKPFVWGPIGHHPLIPSQYLDFYDWSYWIKDRLTWLVKEYFWRFSYSLYQTKQNAAHILCMNSAVPKCLGLIGGYSVCPSVATEDFGWVEDNENDQFTVISAGRFVPLKGFDLTIQAFARMLDMLPVGNRKRCRLVLVGSGPEEQGIQQLIRKQNIQEYVTSIAWIARDELMNMMKTASVFLFPSHEGAGMVVAEALSFGLPVICLDNEGPGEFITEECGFSIPNGRNRDTVEGLAQGLISLYQDDTLHQDLRRSARQRFIEYFQWNKRGDTLAKIYATL